VLLDSLVSHSTILHAYGEVVLQAGKPILHESCHSLCSGWKSLLLLPRLSGRHARLTTGHTGAPGTCPLFWPIEAARD